MSKRYLLLLGNVLLASSGFADGLPDTSGLTKVITVSGGPAYTSPGESHSYQNSVIGYPLTFSYTNQSKGQVLGTGEVFVGLQKNFPSVLARLGVAFAGSTPATIKGNFAVNGTPATSYQYKVSHARIAAKALVAACPSFWVNPYLSSSVGVGFNSSNHFQTTPPIYFGFTDGSTALYNYKANTSTGLAFTVGAGANFQLNSNWEFGLGYEFAAWGKSQLSRTPPISPAITMPTLNNLYTHELQFSISFLYY